MITDSINNQGDNLEVHSDGLVLNLSYWDCECHSNFIKSNTVIQCLDCGSERDFSTNSREAEVQKFIYKN